MSKDFRASLNIGLVALLLAVVPRVSAQFTIAWSSANADGISAAPTSPQPTDTTPKDNYSSFWFFLHYASTSPSLVVLLSLVVVGIAIALLVAYFWRRHRLRASGSGKATSSPSANDEQSRSRTGSGSGADSVQGSGTDSNDFNAGQRMKFQQLSQNDEAEPAADSRAHIYASGAPLLAVTIGDEKRQD